MSDLNPIRILHLASSYPDPIGPDTSASSLLLEGTGDLDHQVFSFKRAAWRGGIQDIPFSDPAGAAHLATAYGAPGKGVYFKRNLDRLADHFMAKILAHTELPDLIHGHKLTMDGYLAATLANRLKRPFLITLQSNTDTKVLGARPDLKHIFRSIWNNAHSVFAFAPVSAEVVSNVLGPRQSEAIYLPPPTRADEILAPKIRLNGEPPVISTAFNLDHYENKNVEALIKSVAIAAKQVPEIKLTIIGGGSPRAFLKVADMGDRLAPGRVNLLGAKPQRDMARILNRSTGFALISKRESFGMVFAEALLAGTPVLYPSGRAIDGYFRNTRFALRANPFKISEIAQGLVELCRSEHLTKSKLKDAQNAGDLAFLQRTEISKLYQKTVRDALCR